MITDQRASDRESVVSNVKTQVRPLQAAPSPLCPTAPAVRPFLPAVRCHQTSAQPPKGGPAEEQQELRGCCWQVETLMHNEVVKSRIEDGDLLVLPPPTHTHTQHQSGTGMVLLSDSCGCCGHSCSVC